MFLDYNSIVFFLILHTVQHKIIFSFFLYKITRTNFPKLYSILRYDRKCVNFKRKAVIMLFELFAL